MVIVNDKRTPAPIKYDFSDKAGERTVTAVIDLLSPPLAVALIEHGAPVTLDVFLSQYAFPPGNDIYFVTPDNMEDADQIFHAKFGEFLRGKAHIAMFRDWISGTLYLREVTNDTGTEDAA